MVLKRSLRSSSVIIQCQIKASSVCMCGCLWVAGQRCSWTFSTCYIVKKTARPLSGCCTVPRKPYKPCLLCISQAQRKNCNRQRSKKSQSIAERRTEDRDRDRIKSQRTNDDDDDGERLAWWCGWAGCLGTINFVWYLFLFYWYAPWGGKCHHGLAIDVCLVDDWLVWHLILWLTVKDGVMESREHRWPLFPTPVSPSYLLLSAPSIIYLPLPLLYIFHCLVSHTSAS